MGVSQDSRRDLPVAEDEVQDVKRCQVFLFDGQVDGRPVARQVGEYGFHVHAFGVDLEQLPNVPQLHSL